MNCWLNAECLFPLNVSKRPAKRCILSMSKIAWGYQLFLNNPYLGPKLRVKLSLLVNKLRLIFWSLNFVLQIIFPARCSRKYFQYCRCKIKQDYKRCPECVQCSAAVDKCQQLEGITLCSQLCDHTYCYAINWILLSTDLLDASYGTFCAGLYWLHLENLLEAP